MLSKLRHKSMTQDPAKPQFFFLYMVCFWLITTFKDNFLWWAYILSTDLALDLDVLVLASHSKVDDLIGSLKCVVTNSG